MILLKPVDFILCTVTQTAFTPALECLTSNNTCFRMQNERTPARAIPDRETLEGTDLEGTIFEEPT